MGRDPCHPVAQPIMDRGSGSRCSAAARWCSPVRRDVETPSSSAGTCGRRRVSHAGGRIAADGPNHVERPAGRYTPRTCDAAGDWTGTACAHQTCVTEPCQGTCAPGEKQCSGLAPQSCGATGQWQFGATCAASCNAGECKAVARNDQAGSVWSQNGHCYFALQSAAATWTLQRDEWSDRFPQPPSNVNAADLLGTDSLSAVLQLVSDWDSASGYYRRIVQMPPFLLHPGPPRPRCASGAPPRPSHASPALVATAACNEPAVELGELGASDHRARLQLCWPAAPARRKRTVHKGLLMQSSRQRLAVQRMESLPVPYTTTMLPPPPDATDRWLPLSELSFDEGDDFGTYDAEQWFHDERPTDVEDLRTIPVSA
jgi:hypothetical protein